MNIIQTFWSGNSLQNPLRNRAGWLSPEYHWLSWALSCLTHHKFYDKIDLYTDSTGEEILVNILKLPYKVHLTHHAISDISSKMWVLAKIFTYSIQNSPFLHVDGDIYIWEKYDSKIENAALIAQNLEIDFRLYKELLLVINQSFSDIPEEFDFQNITETHSSNLGITGGQNYHFFKTYADKVFPFVLKNIEHIDKESSLYYSMVLEQLTFHQLANFENIPVEYLLKPVDDITYPLFARFECVPYQTKFIHTLGDFKRTAVTCQHLAKRLRKDFPTYYYHIMKVCQESGIELHNKAYQLPELSPIRHEATYFLQLKDGYKNFEKKEWLYFYGKDMATYEAVEALYSLPFDELLNQELIFDIEAEIIEISEPIFRQMLKVANIQTLSYEEIELDSLNMVLIDAFLEQKTISQTIEEISIYFSEEEIEADYQKFRNLVLDRIKEGMYQGSLKWVKDDR